MDFIKAIIKPTYWITHQHPVPEAWQLGLTIFFAVIVVIGLIGTILSFIKLFKKPFRHLFSRLGAWGWTMGLLGLALLFFSVERIAFISARMFYLFWLAIAIWWLVFLIRYAIKDIPRNIDFQKQKEESEKYLPKKKKK
jgi:amino acid transporter